MISYVQLLSKTMHKRPIALMSFFRELFGKRAPRTLEPFDWWNYSAPVCPPMSVIEGVRDTGRSIDWQNLFWDGLVARAIFYRTRPATPEESEDGFITHVLPGSYVVSKTRWLTKISSLKAPKTEGGY